MNFWPADISRIKLVNMNTTELWWFKEQYDTWQWETLDQGEPGGKKIIKMFNGEVYSLEFNYKWDRVIDYDGIPIENSTSADAIVFSKITKVRIK